MTEIFNLIANQGFSIVAAVGVFIAFYKTINSHTEEIQTLNKQHNDEMKTIMAQLNSNTEQLRANSENIRLLLDEIHALRQ